MKKKTSCRDYIGNQLNYDNQLKMLNSSFDKHVDDKEEENKKNSRSKWSKKKNKRRRD